MSEKEKKDTKFQKGNTIGSETRFKPGHTLSKKYKTEYAASLLEYFETCDSLPTIEGWAVKNRIEVRTAVNWSKNEEKYPQFSSAYAQAKAIQKNKLIENGLCDAYNVQLVKFLLINNHEMREKSEQKVEGDTNATVTVNIREVN
jgi:hypothetical protein